MTISYPLKIFLKIIQKRLDKQLKVVYNSNIRVDKEIEMKKYEPTNKALAIAEIRHQTGLNYTECKKILDQVDNPKKGA